MWDIHVLYLIWDNTDMHNTNKHTKRGVRSFVFFFEKIRNGKGGGKAKVGRDTDKSANNPKVRGYVHDFTSHLLSSASTCSPYSNIAIKAITRQLNQI